MLFQMRNKDEVLKLLTKVFQQDQITETESYFAKGVASSAPTVSEEKGMPTLQNLS